MKSWVKMSVHALTSMRFAKKQLKGACRGNFARHLRMESLEDRQMLSAVTVNTLEDQDNGIY